MTYKERLAHAIVVAWKLDPQEAGSLSNDEFRSAYLIHAILVDLFVNPADEARWLRDKLPVLGGMSPLERIRTGLPGMIEVEALVRRMANL